MHLLNNKNILNTLLQGLNLGIIVIDQNCLIICWNQWLEKFSNLDSGKVVGQDIRKIFPAIQERNKDNYLQQAVQHGRPVILSTQFHDYLIPIKLSNGSGWHYMRQNVRILPFAQGENDTGALIVVEDVTENILHEKEKANLESCHAHASKMQAVGTLAGGIAHEFNNLLGVIMGSTDMARDETAKDSFARKQLDRAIKASYRAKNLIKQILIFSRKSDSELKVLNLVPLLKETLKMSELLIPSSVQIKLHLCNDCGEVLADASEFNQIILNLISNAVSAMTEKGVCRVELEQVEIVKQQRISSFRLRPGPYAKLTVSDSGHGMNALTKARIFEPFFTTKEVGKGTGLGLSLVFGFMEKYGGAIDVESEIGKGASFHLYFPVIEQVADKEIVAIHQLPTGNERILFVDDNQMYAEMGGDLLEQLGYAVTVKTNSREALDLFKAEPDSFDLVISDQIMLNLSGDELVKEIKVIRPEILTILCTGFSNQMDEKKAMIHGIEAFAMKPLLKKDIAMLIRKVLDKKS